VLSEATCYELLAAATFGRVAVTIGAEPAILPVNYALLGHDVVFRTDPGSKLSAALMGVQVAFEVDEAGGPGDGWSVVLVGHAEEVRDLETLAEIELLQLEPWAAGTREHVVRIRAKHVSGRALA